MKKLFTIIVLMCLTATLMAQEYELYKCSNTGSRTKEDSGVWSEWTYYETDFILRMCLEEGKLEFNNRTSTVFYFNEKQSEHSGVDKDGDDYKTIEWSGYDQDGLRCHLISIDYKSLSNRNFIIRYLDAEVFFETKLLSSPKTTNTSI